MGSVGIVKDANETIFQERTDIFKVYLHNDDAATQLVRGERHHPTAF